MGKIGVDRQTRASCGMPDGMLDSSVAALMTYEKKPISKQGRTYSILSKKLTTNALIVQAEAIAAYGCQASFLCESA